MADTTITGLPNASTLTGSERVPMDQAGTTVDASTQAIAALATKETVGLGNVDNTSDANKPISTAVQTALNGKAAASAPAAAVTAHEAAADPHPQYLTAAEGNAAYATAAQGALAATAVQPGALGNAASRNVGTTAGTVAAGDDSRFAELKARLDAFRDAATFWVSKRATASNSNNGTSDGEPFLSIGAAVAAANAYVSANPGAFAKILVGPGEYVESGLPFRLKPNILAQGSLQRGTVVKPAAGEELNGFFALDSGCMVVDFRFSGHQATGTSATDSSVGQRAWAIRFNEQANGGTGVYLTASPYVKDCASITAEDDAGQAGSTSTGDTGGGVEVDGAKCKSDSPIRSMVVYGFTQQNLGGPGCVVKNDAYAELVSFFGLFGTWHVQAEKGGQATLSGGGCSEFGTYGLVADGYSATALFTGTLRVAASSGATTVDVTGMTANRLGSSSRPAAGQIMLLGGVAYVVQSGTPITSGGSVVADSDPTRAGYRVAFYNPAGAGLAANVAQGATADFRQRSQISAGCHSANYVGSGTNYSALPWNGGVPIRANEAVERNLGRVFGLIVNDVGDVRIAGGAFAVDGTTGAVTINTTQFSLSGLNAIGPFSRNGGISTVGVQLQEVSNDASLLSSTGSSDGNTAPTQFAVRSYVDGRFLAGLTATAGQPLTISDTSTQDASGFWTRSRNIALSLNAPNGLLRLNGSGVIGSGQMPTTDSMSEGSVNLWFTQARARQAISVSGSLSYNATTGVISYTAPTLATVATTGAYADLSGRPTLGTAAATDSSAYATAAQGAKADTAVQPAALSSYVQTSDSRLSDSREWSAATVDQAEAEAGTATTRRAWTAQRVFQAIAAWWAASAAKTKLDGIATGATANSTDAQLRDRSTHTGTQAAGTITGLAASATTDTTNASNISSGTLAAARLPATAALTSGSTITQQYALRQSITISNSTYTLDVTSGNEFVTGAAIAGNVTINLSNLASIPANALWRGVLRFAYTSGTISWFTGNSGYTVKWDGGSAITPTASETECVVIEVYGTTIEVAALKGRA